MTVSNTCLLMDRLYVPEHLVREEDLQEFIYTFSEEEKEEYESLVDEHGRQTGFAMLSSGVREVKTFNKVRNPDNGQTYFGFARGNIKKIKRLFGDYEWEDLRARPKMTSALAFREDRKLYTYKEKGRGQQRAVKQWLSKRYGIIRGSPRFGKTVSAVYIATKLRLKTVIIANQIDLLRQFYKEFEEFTNLKEVQESLAPKARGPKPAPKRKKRDATGQVVGYFNDYDNPEELDVCLLSWQKFSSKYGAERIEKYKDAWGLVCVDEAHRLGGIVYASVVNKLNAKHRMGLTGTVERVDTKESILKDVIGPVTAEGKSRQVPCKVTAIFTGAKVKYTFNEPFVFLMKRTYNNEKRMAIVYDYLDDDVRAGLNICIAFHAASNAQLLEFTQSLRNLGYKATAFCGAIAKPIREETLEQFRTGEIQVAVCNNRMLTGLNVPRWDCYYSLFPNSNVVLKKIKGEGYRLSGNFYQEYSRIRTMFDYEDGTTKEMGIIRDFIDINPISQGSFKKRLKAYKHEKFEVEYLSLIHI